MGFLKIIGVIAAIIIALIFYGFSGEIGRQIGKKASADYSSDKQDAEIERLLLKTSSKINNQLPMMIDEATRIDATMVVGKTMSYRYTIINYAAEDIQKNEFIAEMTNMLKDGLCSSKQVKTLMNFGVKHHYNIFGNDGRLIGYIQIDKNSCEY